MLKHSEDLRSIVFVMIAIFLTVAGLLFPPSGLLAVVWFVAQFVFSYCCCVINHNHTHNSIFIRRPLNRLFGYLLTIAKGHTSAQVIVPHNLNHHVYAGKNEDWSRPELASGKIGLIRIPTYLFRASREMNRQRKLTSAPKLPSGMQRQAAQERIVLFIFAALCLVFNWHHFMFFILPIWISVMLTLLSANLLQHDGCDAHSEWEHARNFTGALGNWMMFNNGYHTIHHFKPTLHWKFLPGEHRKQVEPHLNGQLEEKSIPSFLVKKYLFKPMRFQSPALVSAQAKAGAAHP